MIHTIQDLERTRRYLVSTGTSNSNLKELEVLPKGAMSVISVGGKEYKILSEKVITADSKAIVDIQVIDTMGESKKLKIIKGDGNIIFQELEIDPVDFSYTNDEYDDIKTIKDGLDTLLYIAPVISNFKMSPSGITEFGTIISELQFSWNYNKKHLEYQKIGDVVLDTDIRKITLPVNITENTTYTLTVYDGKNIATAKSSITFLEYLYFGSWKDGESQAFTSQSSNNKTFTINVQEGKRAYIFIPNSTKLTQIWYNNTDSTSDFIIESYTHLSNTGSSVDGVLCKSKNTGLGQITLTLK